MVHTMTDALRQNFLGNSPSWYKLTIVGFLILNPIIAVYDPLIRLSYGRMVVMALPYTITMSITGLLALWYLG